MRQKARGVRSGDRRRRSAADQRGISRCGMFPADAIAEVILWKHLRILLGLLLHQIQQSLGEIRILAASTIAFASRKAVSTVSRVGTSTKSG